MNKKSLYELPVASTDFISEATIDWLGALPVLRYSYRENGKVIDSGIAFNGVSAFRYRSESCCNVWNIEGVYDTLAEISESTWVEEVREDVAPVFRQEWAPKHFMIYFDSVGCFEFIADGWKLLSDNTMDVDLS
ncbi:hypothetical protein ACTJI2_02185 [Pseudoxanthomonas sp. 22568]|uniref:hypothetical protein n=1 Tax=Pseudoxanthomonas sp. 22568 TaxID=3453945 RepID=UPI003F8360AE